MLQKRRQAAEDVAFKLSELEKSLERTVELAALLAAEIPAAGRRAGLSIVLADDASQAIGNAFSSLISARAHTVKAHHELAEVHRRLGLREYAGGMGWKSVPQAEKTLHAVSAQAA